MQVHFELFLRRNVAASWMLELATEDRALAVDTAEILLSEKRAIAVRLIKETLNPETNEFRSITLFTKGDVSQHNKVKAASDALQGPLCVDPADLYTVHAREVVGRLFDEWLRRKRVTVFELLHRTDLAEQLDASGMELQHAIQKISIPEAQTRGVSTHEIMRHYSKLAERTIERIIKGRRSFPDFAERGFGELANRLSAEADGAYLLGGGVALHMKAGQSWSDKVDLLLDLAEIAPEENRAFAFAVLIQPLSEILGSRGGLADFAGGELDLGGSLALLTRLIASAEVDMMGRIEPSLERQFPPLTPQIARLAAWLKNKAFADVRAALARRILAELNGPRRLRAGDPQGEIAILRALAMVLTAFAGHGQVLSPDDVHAAFTERSRALVASDFVHAYAGSAPTAMAETQALMRLAENVVGGANKRSAAKWIVAASGALRFERELRTCTDSPAARLGRLADLQHALDRIGLPEADRALIAGKIGEVGGLVEADTGYTAFLAKAPATAIDRVTRLLGLASGQTAPLGPVSTRARVEIEKLVRTPAVRAELSQVPEVVDKLRSVLAA